MPQRRCASDDKEPFLCRFFVVVGAYSLAGRQLIHAEPGALRAQGRSDSNAVSPKTIRKLRTRRTGNRAEIYSPHQVGTHEVLLRIGATHVRDPPAAENSSAPTRSSLASSGDIAERWPSRS